MALSIYVILLCVSSVLCDVCPKQCDCDMNDGLNRATCVDQNIIGIDVGVPTPVQVYSLRHNVISELDNFCFKVCSSFNFLKSQIFVYLRQGHVLGLIYIYIYYLFAYLFPYFK